MNGEKENLLAMEKKENGMDGKRGEMRQRRCQCRLFLLARAECAEVAIAGRERRGDQFNAERQTPNPRRETTSISVSAGEAVRVAYRSQNGFGDTIKIKF